MQLKRKALWRGSRLYVRYSKNVKTRIAVLRREVDRIRHLATDPLAFNFDFDLEEGDC